MTSSDWRAAAAVLEDGIERGGREEKRDSVDGAEGKQKKPRPATLFRAMDACAQSS